MTQQRIRLSPPTLAFLAALTIYSTANAEIQSNIGDHRSKAKTASDGTVRTQKAYNWSLFGGIGGGLGFVSDSNYSSSPQGKEFLINADLSYNYKRWIFDGGIGWIYSNVSGKSNTQQNIQIITRSGLLGISPRYEIADRWQLGPIANLAFGTDTSFSSNLGDSKGSLFLGLKGVYEIPYSQLPVRLWSQISTDLNMGDQRAYLALLGIQIGLPLNLRSSEQPKAPLLTQYQAKASQQIRVTLDPQKIFFATNSASLKSDVQATLKDIGTYLQENEKKGSVEISGHADQRGSFQYNLKLSKRRADSVRNAFMLGNLESSKLTAQAYSHSHPEDPKNNVLAWKKNRRVELVFDGIEKTGELYEKLKPLIIDSSWMTQLGGSHHDEI